MAFQNIIFKEYLNLVFVNVYIHFWIWIRIRQKFRPDPDPQHWLNYISVLRIRIRKNPKLFAGSEFEFGFRSNQKRLMEKMEANVLIIINRSTNQVITEVRASILFVHIHAKRIADTFENLYFLYHLCRIRIWKKEFWIRIRKKLIRNRNTAKYGIKVKFCFLQYWSYYLISGVCIQ
jgi:hypothetical protein